MNQHQESILQDQMSEMDLTISNDLIEAYKGYYEDEWMYEFGEYETEGTESPAYTKWSKEKILNHSPKERLEIYCEWNGILGYHSRLFEIATGEL